MIRRLLHAFLRRLNAYVVEFLNRHAAYCPQCRRRHIFAGDDGTQMVTCDDYTRMMRSLAGE